MQTLRQLKIFGKYINDLFASSSFECIDLLLMANNGVEPPKKISMSEESKSLKGEI